MGSSVGASELRSMPITICLFYFCFWFCGTIMPFSTKNIFLPELCKDLSPRLYQCFFRFYLPTYTSICVCKEWHKRKSEDI